MTDRKAYTNAVTPSGEQATLYAYDDLNRLIRTVYPDSDDTIGGGNGGDSTYDRVEYTYNAVSSITTVKEQRAGIITNTLDELQRLTQSEVTTTPSGVTTGDTKRTYTFNTKGQLTDVKSDCAHVAFAYDDLWRVTTETQKIRIDGTGFTNGWGQAVDIDYEFNKNSLRTRMVVDSGWGSNDLDLDYAYNARLQLTTISGDTFHNSSNTFVTYDHWGSRVYNKYLGGTTGPIKNARAYDDKPRLARNVWQNVPGSNAVLVRTNYGYDDVDNPLWEQWDHDKVSNSGLYDNFRYNDKYELTGVNYREGSSADYRSSITVSDEFAYDANYNRGDDIEDGDPFEYYGRSLIDYTANSANEYTAITGATAPVHDRAGNLTGLPSIPGTGTSAGTQKDLTAKWSAFNQLTQVDYGTKPNQERQAYIYDGLNRRIARLTYQYAVFGEASYMIPDVGKRYIYDGFSCVEELLLDTDGEDEEEIFVDSGTLERVYVHGASIDEPLYCAIDRNGDRDVSDNRNAGGASDDAEFWYLHNRLGSILAIAEITFGEPDTVRVLEYYKYSVYGQVDVLPIVDDGSGGGTASDGIEDTPTTLADNQSLMISNRSGSADAGRYSPFGNEFLFTARRLDARTGLYYYRHRYYNWLMGRFTSRDPIGYADGMNLYGYVGNSPLGFIDSFGLQGDENDDSPSGPQKEMLRSLFEGLFHFDINIPITSYLLYNIAKQFDGPQGIQRQINQVVKAIFGGDDQNTELNARDAVRHCVWNCMGVMAVMESSTLGFSVDAAVSYVETVTSWHEHHARDNSPIETSMDLHNNRIGARCGAAVNNSWEFGYGNGCERGTLVRSVQGRPNVEEYSTFEKECIGCCLRKLFNGNLKIIENGILKQAPYGWRFIDSDAVRSNFSNWFHDVLYPRNTRGH